MYTVQTRIYVYFSMTYTCSFGTIHPCVTRRHQGSTLELYNQISFAYHLLQVVEVKQERMTEI